MNKRQIIASVFLLFLIPFILSQQREFRVVSVSGNEITINADARDGVKQGFTGRTYKESQYEGKTVPIYTAKFEITSVANDTCKAKITAQTAAIDKNQKVIFDQKLTSSLQQSKPKVVQKPLKVKPPKTVEENKPLNYLNKANQLFTNGDYAEAKENYEKILSIVPDDSFAKIRINECDKKIAEAERKAVELNKVDYYRKAGKELADAGKYAQALSYYERILAVLPTDKDANYNAERLKPLRGLSGIWPMFRGDPQHTGRSLYKGPEKPRLKWEFVTGHIIHFSSPAIASDGTIYVWSWDNKLYAINPDGSKKWEFVTTTPVGAIPAISSPSIDSDGTIYVGSIDNKLYAINPDGSKKWEFATGYAIDSSPAISSDGTIYVGSIDNKLYAINPDGSKKWEFATKGHIHSSPAISSDGTIYVGSWDHKLYAINPDGSKKWEFVTGEYIHSSPAISSDGTIYVGSRDGRLYAINPDGSKKWEFVTGNEIHSSPVIDTDSTIYVGSDDNKLYSINPDGSKKWEFTTGGNVFCSPAIGADGIIYVGSEDHKLYAIH